VIVPITTEAIVLDIIITGAGMTGLTAAALLARDGHQVTVLDRDPQGPPAGAQAAWDAWQRPGVAQFRQLHFALPRWRQVMERELPAVLETLAAMGAAATNVLHLNPEVITGGWQPGDEQFETRTARRPVLEAAVAAVAEATPGVRVLRGTAATGLLTERGPDAVPVVVGVRTGHGALRADYVVDAGGRRTPVPGWVRALGVRPPLESVGDSSLVYYPRHYRSRDGRIPDGHRSALTHHESFSLLTLPADGGTWSVGFVTSARDRVMRGLRDARRWEAAVRRVPAAAPWIDAEPITDVQPFGGMHDLQRSYVVDGEPVVTGLGGLGDAWAATNPSLGRGLSIGAVQACGLRDLIATGADPRSADFARSYAEASDREAGPLVASTIGFGRHRLAEMVAEMEGVPYRTDDPSWAMTTALMAGARHDPVLLRAYARIASLLALPAQVLGDSQVQARLRPYLGAPRYPDGDCTRADLLAVLEDVPSVTSGSPR
jgi:2-polyprenyl-6-methoxyphenol hydroxylase-like FAD-dependent oxidoreductase